MHIQGIQEDEKVCVSSEVRQQDNTLFTFDKLLDSVYP